MNKIKSIYRKYDDLYETCEDTHATLRIYLPDGRDPKELTNLLGIEPSKTQTRGEVRNGKPKNWPNGWFLYTAEKVHSKDLRRHLDWLLEQLEDKVAVIKQLQREDFEIYINCFWASAFGHGGPVLDPKILKRISKINIGISFDIYFAGDDIGDALKRAKDKIKKNPVQEITD